MRILHLVSSLEIGGAERLLADLARHQASVGDEVRILTLSRGGSLAEGLRRDGVEVTEFETRRGALATRVRELWRLFGALRRWKQDVIHSWMYHAGVLALLSPHNRRRVVVSIHHDDPSDRTMSLSTRFVARSLSVLSRRSAAVVYVSQSARANHEAAGYPQSRSCTVSGGVDASRFTPMTTTARAVVRAKIDPTAEPSAKIVIYVARFHIDKDPATMIEATAEVIRRGVPLRLWMVGRGMAADNGPLTAMIREGGVESAVTLVGELSHPETILPAGDVIAVSSRTESFGLALIEGMLCGLSPVSTAVGIAAKVLPNERLAEPGDSTTLAQALATAALNDQHGEAFRAAAMHYSLDAMSRTYARIYGAILRPEGDLGSPFAPGSN